MTLSTFIKTTCIGWLALFFSKMMNIIFAATISYIIGVLFPWFIIPIELIGLHNFEIWQFGAFLGFVGGFFHEETKVRFKL